MIPNQFLKDPHYSYYSSLLGANLPAPAILPNLPGMDYLEHQKALGRAQANIQANTNIDSLLHVHRRKLQRRAANRKSAQLSRARKKAHLEELTVENTRLQQLVDVLDSQPELIFCITSRGDLTYISERTVNFVSINNTSEDNEEEPTHISQILSKESVESVLKTIHEIMKVSPPHSALAESSMLFSSKVVEFRDSFGHPLIGYMRCARVNRRAPAVSEEFVDDEESEAPTPAPAAKKSKAKHDVESQEAKRATTTAATLSAMPFTAAGTAAAAPGMQISNLGADEWNLTNFKMLTDCVSNLADRHDQQMRESTGGKDSGAKESGHKHSLAAITPPAASAAASTAAAHAAASADPEAESEFVCVIRTSDSYFARYSTRSDLYMFVSTPLSAASMEAHDQKDILHGLGRHPGLGGSSSSGSRANERPKESAAANKDKLLTKPALKAASSSGSSGSDKSGGTTSRGDSSGSLPVSSESSSAKAGASSSNNTSSETGSDDNNAEAFN